MIFLYETEGIIVFVNIILIIFIIAKYQYLT